MSMNETIVSTVFRFINLGVLIGLFSYLFKRKLLPIVIETIASKRAVLQNLAQENKSLLVQKQEVEQKIREQEITSKYLYDQVKIWSLVFDQRFLACQDEQRLLMRKSMQRSKTRADFAMYTSTRNTVCKKALDASQQNLRDHFSSKKEGRHFITSLVNFARKDLK